jgi:hypothetical protein
MEARDIQDMAREFSEEAMKIAMQIARNEDAADSARLQAIDMIHNRGYGKAPITNINANINADAKPEELDAVELDKRVRETLSRVERLTSRETEASEGQGRPADLFKYN